MNRLMIYCPARKTKNPYPSCAEQWREYHGDTAWLYNPYTGNKRAPEDIGSDPFGHGIENKFIQA